MPDWNWLWQAATWDWVLVPLGGILLAYLRKKNPNWAGVLIYGLGGSAFIALIIFALMGRPMLSRPKPQTTTDNVEANIKTWADDLSLSVQKQTDNNFSFVVGIGLPSGRMVQVGKPKQRDRYLQFQGNMALGPEHLAFLKKMTLPQMERVSDEINLEMARSKIGFLIVGTPFKGIVVTKGVPITSSLTEDSFAASLDEIDSSMLLAREAIRLAFFHSGMTTPEAMLHPLLSQ
jgi:hypothetical protein